MNARFALVGRLTLLLSVFLLALYGVGLWVEGEKEAHILCGLVQIGESETEVRRLFGTAALMQVANDTVRGEAGIRAEAAVGPSYYRCRFGVRDGAVVSTSRGWQLPTQTVALLVFLAGLPLVLLGHVRRRQGAGPAWFTNSWALAAGWGLLALTAVPFILNAPL